MVKPFDLIRTAKEKLIHSDTPQLDAEVLLSYVLGKDRIYLFLNRNEEISSENEQVFNQLVERRSQGEPIAYIIGSKEFMGLDFKVKPGVLIPRADTEILVEEIIKRVQGDSNTKKADSTTDGKLLVKEELRAAINAVQTVEAIENKKSIIHMDEAIENEKSMIPMDETIENVQRDKLIIVDIGCGSGAISISLAKYMERSMVYALDIMDVPIELTTENAKRNNVENRVKAIKSDLMSELDHKFLESIDVIVSNPPYIEQHEYEQLMVDVKKFEPKSALTDEGDGLEFYRRITVEAAAYLKKNGLLAYEIGYNQAESVSKIMRENGFCKIECIKDLADKDRVVVGYFSGKK